ncbi:MAG: AmmeMemoRadiSam system radical SAM enzyme [Candidatus Omnitrophica bacterium]|nr:AmmeMemoRadiSam system radical SAM enzyme [Candidatus Omnitrophota bacterium]
MKNVRNPVFSIAFLFFLFFFCIFSPDLYSLEQPKEAAFYQKLVNKLVQCRLCPRRCAVPDGRRGYCGVRENRSGVLYTLVYAKPVAIHIDPIEKKPLFHFLPSTTAYSIATAGCNLKCKFCQNWEISQNRPEGVEYRYLEPEELVNNAWESGAPTIAYTYSEPTVFYEYMLETARLARRKGLKNIMHSNGYINEEPLRALAKFLDAANIDLKGFSEEYYAKLTEGSLEPVLHSLKVLREEGVHIEITTLLLPGFNDDEPTLKKMCAWIKDNLGADTPLHFSRFFPMYKLTGLNPTPVGSLERARKIAIDCGLNYVYIGNIPPGPAENTYCPGCKKIVIERSGYFIVQNNLKEGRCKFCGKEIAGVWD